MQNNRIMRLTFVDLISAFGSGLNLTINVL